MFPGRDTRILILRLLRDFFQSLDQLPVAERLAMIPLANAPVSRPVNVWWDEHQVPFIEAESDADLAVALGIVHAHLRLAQMELVRRASHGRLSELVGRRGLTIDRLVRTFDIARAAPQILAEMPQATRLWLEGFARGINHVIAHGQAPREFHLFELNNEYWSAADVVVLGRLISADVNWLVWQRIFPLRGRADWPRLWRDFCTADMLSVGADESGNDLLPAIVRSGSNSFAVAGAKSRSGGGLIASDPHLSITLPNSWLLAGMKSPSHHAVGMMIPGIPFIALGRNPWIGWGGTSLHAASSDLVAVPSEARLSIREERIEVLGGPPVTLRVHESDWGPVISDLPAFSSRDAVALRWMGHQPSDEFTAMLRVATARSWTEFRQALAGYAVPGLEMVFAAASGEIGIVTAAELPNRRNAVPEDIVAAADSGWDECWSAENLPSEFQPERGFIASANARLTAPEPLIGYHFSPPIRIRRLEKLLGGSDVLSLNELMQFQNDVHSTAALRERDAFWDWLSGMPEHEPLRKLLLEWDGNYDANSKAALALETLFVCLARDLVPDELRHAWEASWGSRVLIWRAIQAAPEQARKRALHKAASVAARNIRSGDWGTRHRLALQHLLGMLPVVGRRYRVSDLPASGTSESLLKTAHGLTVERHRASYGSVSRHVSDLADPDENYFALLGGQDGWIGSSTFADQVNLWQRSDYVRIPLRPETVRQTFPHQIVLRPDA
jgi:penicillin amidase